MRKTGVRWGLTPGERRAVLFLCAVFLIGWSYRIYQRSQLPRAIPPEACDSLAVEAIRAGEALPGTTEEQTEPADQAGQSEKITLLDINAASKAEFERLPGIGPVLADRIIALRQQSGGFNTPRDLLEVEGIGRGRFARIDTLICCKPAGTNRQSANISTR